MNEAQFSILKSNAINELHTYVNRTAPLIIEQLKKGFKQKADFSLYEKDRLLINEILEDGDSIPARHTFVDATQYSIRIGYKTCYRSREESGCHYHTESIYVYQVTEKRFIDFEPIPMITAKQLEEAKLRLLKIREERDELRNEEHKLKTLLGF